MTNYNVPRIKKYSATGNILMVAEFVDNKKWEKFIKSETEKDESLDGIIFIERDVDNKSTKWTYFNRDGSQVAFCGNGIRCIGKYLSEFYNELTGELNSKSIAKCEYEINDKNIYFKSPKGIIVPNESQNKKIYEIVRQFEFLEVEHIILVVVGVPHLVLDCKCNVMELDDCIIEYLSNAIHTATNPNFNINFINVVDTQNINIRTFERGVNRETGSCGSGCLASYYYLMNKTVKVNYKCKIHFKKDGFMELYFDNVDESYHLGGQVKEIL